MIVSFEVRRRARQQFNARDAEDVLRLLEATQLDLGSDSARGNERLQYAILMLAGGDFERFARALALAVADWRDLLVTAGLADADWPEVLRRAGYTLTAPAI